MITKVLLASFLETGETTKSLEYGKVSRNRRNDKIPYG